jgi:hypothetical protein
MTRELVQLLAKDPEAMVAAWRDALERTSGHPDARTVRESARVILTAELLLGIGMGCVMTPAFSLATLGVKPRNAGITSAHNSLQQLGATAGVALLNTIARSQIASDYLRPVRNELRATVAEVAVSPGTALTDPRS